MKKHRQRGFSLVELVGVLAVMAVMATMLMPVLIRQLQLAATEQEVQDMERVAQGLRSHIVRAKQIPDETAWAEAVAEELGRPVSEVITNSRRGPRVFLIDPAFRVGAEEEDVLPYAQGMSGSLEPVSPRLIILSNLDPSKVVPVSAGVIDAEDFEALWNIAEGRAPLDWSGRWSTGGEDLIIQRINLAPLFKRIILNTFDSAALGFYAIDDASSSTLPSSGVDAWYLEGTMLSLYDSAHELESRQILKQPATFVYQRDAWRGQIYEGLELTDDDLYLANTLLTNSAQNPDAPGGGTPTGLMNALNNYMNRYAEWDAEGFPGSGSASHNAVEAAGQTLKSVSENLIYKPLPQ